MSLINAVLVDLDRRDYREALPGANAGLSAEGLGQRESSVKLKNGSLIAGAVTVALVVGVFSALAAMGYGKSTKRDDAAVVTASALSGSAPSSAPAAAQAVSLRLAKAASASVPPVVVAAADASAASIDPTVPAIVPPIENAAVAPSALQPPAPSQPPIGQPLAGPAPRADTPPAPVRMYVPSGPARPDWPVLVNPAESAGPGEAQAVRPPGPPPAALPRAALAAASAPTAVPAVALEMRLEKREHKLSARQRAEVAYQRGLALHQQGLLRDAEDTFRAAIGDDPRLASARQALAVELAGTDRFGEAQILLAEGIQLDPNNTTLPITLGRLQFEHNDLAGALSTLEEATAADKRSSPQTQALYATVLQRSGRNLEAADNYRKALSAYPDNAAWWLGLGIALSGADKADSAREAFERARALGTLGPDLQQYVERRLAPNE